MRAPSWWPNRGLWRHREFLRLWSAQIVSAFGSRITRTALPVLAVVVLDQGEGALGALAALQLGPMIAVALIAGGIVDRGSKRRIMVLADLARAALVASLPIAAWLGGLTMVHVDLVAAGVGACTSLFRIADGAFLPAIVGVDHIAEGNAKLESTEAAAEIAGPSAAGALIGVLGAPLAVLIDAATYLWSAAFLGAITTRETVAPRTTQTSFRADLVVGVRAIFGPQILRRLVLAEMFMSVTWGFFAALYALFCLRELAMSTTTFGVIVSVGGIGALLGAWIARQLPARWGVGWTLVLATVLAAAGNFFIPAAGSFGPTIGIAMLVAQQLTSDGAMVMFTIHAATMRQTLLPREQLGRANAAVLACNVSVVLAAALGAGAIGELVGTRTSMIIGPAVGLLAPIMLLPLRGMREIPKPTPEPERDP
ncbi:MAG TPA: MFS transporter [Kofleriaceae bacterium]|nr:MFS transporter [Kofleriaceae bacterium]